MRSRTRVVITHNILIHRMRRTTELVFSMLFTAYCIHNVGIFNFNSASIYYTRRTFTYNREETISFYEHCIVLHACIKQYCSDVTSLQSLYAFRLDVRKLRAIMLVLRRIIDENVNKLQLLPTNRRRNSVLSCSDCRRYGANDTATAS